MAPSDSRPPFRLPWQSGHGTESGSDAASQTATIDVPAWPSHDLIRRDPRIEAMAMASTTAETPAPATETPEMGSTMPTDWADATTDETAAEMMATTEMT